jgi:adenine-specific DNA-methyltransferase
MIVSPLSSYDRLRNLLHQLFEFDLADLDFGIYRIMNQRRVEIAKFLDDDLLPQVQEVLATLKSDEQERLEQDLAKAYETEASLGVPRGSSQKVKDLEARLAEGQSATDREAEVFSDLYTFFSRYYDEGDFISLRRYKAGVYAIPYEGEEVKYHWANADQYYVKTTEDFRDYRFKLPDGRHAHFRLVVADTGRENNRAENGKDRRFVLREDQPVAEVDGELEMLFDFKPSPIKQAELNDAAIERILDAATIRLWREALCTSLPTASNPERTVLEKHLADYTAKNAFDYFIHKDLGGFLRRELDFFLKNEVAHLDDLDSADAQWAEHYLARLRAVRRIGGKITEFLAQLEEFQKRLYLKKKFVVETNYCITLDRILAITDDAVRAWLMEQIAANDAQREEWIRLFATDEIDASPTNPGYSIPLTVEFLAANDNLLLDTRFFGADFTARLVASIEDLDASLDGLLVHGDNFQTLRLLERRYRDRVKCIYIDPPYNTDSSAIPYKNNYRHSSWITMMRDRLASLHPTLTDDGAIFVSIDKAERTGLEHALDDVFGASNHIEELIWTQSTSNSQLPNYSTNHEYVEVYARDRQAVEADKAMFREPKPGFAEVMELVARLEADYPPLSEVQAAIGALYEEHKVNYRSEVEAAGKPWNAAAKRQDPWKGLYPYKNAEYRDDSGSLVAEGEARERGAKIWVWRELPSGAPASKQSPTTRDSNHANYRYYKPIHPTTGKPCPHPQGGWKFPATQVEESESERRTFESLKADDRIAWGKDESKVPQIKGFLHEVETNIGTSVFYEYNDGEAEVAAMFGRSGLFLSPKSSKFVRRFVSQATKKTHVVLDCFAGTGSTAHAVINVNRADRGNRKYILVEVGEYFDTVLKPRVLKAVYSPDWRDGKPVSREGSSHALKYLRLESYEDALMNIELQAPSSVQRTLLDAMPAVREDYFLRYVLSREAAGSPSLLDLDQFANPFNYQLTIFQPGESRTRVVDLPETFNWLLGLAVERIRFVDGFQTIEGTDPDGQLVLVIWRTLTNPRHSNECLEAFFRGQGYLDRVGADTLDRVYVNGDCTLSSIRPEGATWQVGLTEEAFQRLMFAPAHEGSR